MYCSDVESSGNNEGMFSYRDHKSISVIACDTKNIEKMNRMFANCKSLEKLEFGKIFNTEIVTNMSNMFLGCHSLTELDLKSFDTTKVTDMEYMFSWCKSLTNLKIGKNFNKPKDTNVEEMFKNCNKLHDDIKNKFSN